MAEWLEHHLGVLVPELGFDRLDTPLCVTAEYDWWLGDHGKHWDAMEALYERHGGAAALSGPAWLSD